MWAWFHACPRAIKSCLPHVYPWRHARDKMYQSLSRGEPGNEARGNRTADCKTPIQYARDIQVSPILCEILARFVRLLNWCLILACWKNWSDTSITILILYLFPHNHIPSGKKMVTGLQLVTASQVQFIGCRWIVFVQGSRAASVENVWAVTKVRTLLVITWVSSGLRKLAYVHL